MKYHLFIVFAEYGALFSNRALNLTKKDLLIYYVNHFNNKEPIFVDRRVLLYSQLKRIVILASQFYIRKDFILPNGKKIGDEKNIDYIIDTVRLGKVKGVNEVSQDFITETKKAW